MRWLLGASLAAIVRQAEVGAQGVEAQAGAERAALVRQAAQAKDGVDEKWREYLDAPPAQALSALKALQERATAAVASTTTPNAVTGEVDVVVSGGGNLDAYYLGAQMVFSRAGLEAKRFAGASAGGMMPFEFLLKGEDTTAAQHLAYGVLCEEFKSDFSFSPYGAYLQDRHWRLMADWQTEKYADKLASLDDRMFLALSCLAPLPKLVKVSEFTPKNAASAFMGTGTVAQWYDGMLCSDGGAMSGKKMTPLFQDHARPQVIVDLMATGYPTSMVFPPVHLDQYVALAELGQDHALAFLATGEPAPRGAIALCPKNADTSQNVCKA